jgi:hypothetical protein
MADPDLQRIIDDLRKRREHLEQFIAESAGKTAEVAKSILDVERLRERIGPTTSGGAPPPRAEDDQAR